MVTTAHLHNTTHGYTTRHMDDTTLHMVHMPALLDIHADV